MTIMKTARELVEEKLESNIKSRIQDIIRSYRNFWDPFAETLQNSVDAINRRYRLLNDVDFYLYEEFNEEYDLEFTEDYKGKILIEVWPEENKISISDNGVGIKKEKIEEIILPDVTDKEKNKEYGYKGKGLTYVAFISKYFEITTQYFVKDTANFIALEGLVDWTSARGKVNFPSGPIPEPKTRDEGLASDFNTQITFSLAEDYNELFSRNSNLNYVLDLTREEELLDAFEVVLRTRTAIGNTKVLFNDEPIVPINIKLKVYKDSETWEREIEYRYYHPKEHEELSTRSYNFKEYLNKCPEVGFDKTFTCLSFKEEDITIGSRLPINSNIYFSALSTKRLNDINSSLGLDREGVNEAALTYGVYLAIDGMPTGIKIDDWDQKGGVNKRYFAIADVPLGLSGELDSGRKGITSTRAKQISNEALNLKNKTIEFEGEENSDKFKSYASKYLDFDDSDGIFDDNNDFEERIKQAKESIEDSKEKDLEKFKVLQELSSLEHFPASEEEVRALFHELLAQNLIKGYTTLYAAGSRALYDSGMKYSINLADENTTSEDKLGFSSEFARKLKKSGEDKYEHEERYKKLDMSHPELCVEFKTAIGGLIDEINRPSQTSKSVKEIDLLITWSDEVAPKYQDDYTLATIPEHRRVLHGVTHRLNMISPEATEMHCIVLSEVLDLI